MTCIGVEERLNSRRSPRSYVWLPFFRRVFLEHPAPICEESGGWFFQRDLKRFWLAGSEGFLAGALAGSWLLFAGEKALARSWLFRWLEVGFYSLA